MVVADGKKSMPEDHGDGMGAPIHNTQYSTPTWRQTEEMIGVSIGCTMVK